METEWAAVWIAGGSLLVAAIALVAAGLSARYTRHQRDEARTANALLQRELAARAAAPWSLEHFQNEAYSLTNIWSYPLYEVQVVVPWSAASGRRSWELIDQAATVTFLVTGTEAGQGGDVEVRWKDEPDSDETRTWRTVLPARR
jgi:hypothetical protein